MRQGEAKALLAARREGRAVVLFTPLDGGLQRLLDAAGLALLALTDPDLATAGREALRSDRAQVVTAAGVEVLAESEADWLVMSPSGNFGGTPTGRYRLSAVDPADELTYEDFAVAVVDEIDNPKHRLTQIGVASA